MDERVEVGPLQAFGEREDEETEAEILQERTKTNQKWFEYITGLKATTMWTVSVPREGGAEVTT